MTDLQLPPTDYVTPPMRLAFASLFEKRPKSDNANAKLSFQCTILMPPGTDLQPFSNCLGAAMMDEWNQVIPLAAGKHPLKPADGKIDTNGQPYEGFDPGWWYINCNSGYRPSVLDEHGMDVYKEPPMADEARRKAAVEAAVKTVYSGCWCRFHVRAFAWTHTEGGRGVSFGIEGVLKVRDDEKFASRQAVDTHAAFGIAKPAAAAGAVAPPGAVPLPPGAVPPAAGPGPQLDVNSFLG